MVVGKEYKVIRGVQRLCAEFFICNFQGDRMRQKPVIEVNLIGPFNLIRAAVSELRRQNGRIINVSSGAADLALENVSAYCAAKAALNHFTRVLAAE